MKIEVSCFVPHAHPAALGLDSKRGGQLLGQQARSGSGLMMMTDVALTRALAPLRFLGCLPYYVSSSHVFTGILHACHSKWSACSTMLRSSMPRCGSWCCRAAGSTMAACGTWCSGAPGPHPVRHCSIGVGLVVTWR